MATGQSNKISTYVFLHLNTTCLPGKSQPCRITEICLLAVNQNSLKNTGEQGEPEMPRVLHKLVLCFKPGTEILEEAFDISNLKNEDLDDCPRFSKKTARSLKCFFQTLDEPICLIAHYGNKFDFAVLKAELAKAGKSSLFDDIYCADSLDAIREIDGKEATIYKPALKKRKTTPAMQTNNQTFSMQRSQSAPYTLGDQEKSYSLRPYYKRLFESEADQTHTAEGFCTALFKVAKVTTGFCDWVNKHVKKFEEIEPAAIY